jgi:hypothetical protein
MELLSSKRSLPKGDCRCIGKKLKVYRTVSERSNPTYSHNAIFFRRGVRRVQRQKPETAAFTHKESKPF